MWQARDCHACKYTSHRRTVWSKLPEASVLLSGLNATLCTMSVCPFSGSPSGWWLARRHIPQADTAIGTARGECPAVRAECHAEHRIGMPCERKAEGPARRHVPQTDGVFATRAVTRAA